MSGSSIKMEGGASAFTPTQSVFDEEDGTKSILDSDDAVPLPEIGKAELWEEHDTIGALARTKVAFRVPHCERPGLPLAITALNYRNKNDSRVWCTTTDIQKRDFKLEITPVIADSLRGIRVSYLEILNKHGVYGFQFGETMLNPTLITDYGKYTSEKYGKNHEVEVQFPSAYSKPPIVVVWMSGFDTTHGENFRLELFPEKITKTGFTMSFHTWSKTTLYYAKATWIAYNADTRGILSGIAHTDAQRPRNQPQRFNTGYISLGENAFKKPPRVIAGIYGLDFGKGSLQLDIAVHNVTPYGMTWHANAMGDSIAYGVGIAYIAMV